MPRFKVTFSRIVVIKKDQATGFVVEANDEAEAHKLAVQMLKPEDWEDEFVDEAVKGPTAYVYPIEEWQRWIS